MAAQNVLPVHFNQVTHVCCIGAGHASVMSMAVIAAAHPNVTFTVVDYDFDLMERWTQLINIDFVEPGFEDLLGEVANLFFTDQVEDSINEAQMIFIGVEIPTKGYGIGARSNFDRTQWERAIRSIMTASQASKIIVEKSTMPVDRFNDTMRLLGQRTQVQQNAVQFAVFSNPDLYSPGHAIQDLSHPEQVIIARKSDVGNTNVLQQMYAPIVQDPNRIIVLPDHVSVELAKIATSAIVAGKMNFTNMVAAVCGKTGANFNHVRRVIGSDYRINNSYMDASLGIGGGEIMKDTMHFRDILQQNGLRKQAKVVNEMVKLSKRWSKEFVELVLTGMVTLKNKVIAVFGVTYKSNIADLKNSPAIAVCKHLLTEGAILRIFDPLVNENAIMGCFTRHVNRVQVAANQEEAYDNAHAALCLVATNLQFDFQAMHNAMVIPPYLFIACNLNWDNVNVEDIRDMGFQLYIHGNQIN